MANPIFTGVKNVFNKPKVLIPVAAVVAIAIGISGYYAFFTTKHFTTSTVADGTVSAQLTSTGTVKAATETMLAFPVGGRIDSVNVKVGDTVSQGQTLASVDSSTAYGAVQQAQGALASAQANYNLLLDGASSSAIEVAQVAYDNTVSAQKAAVAASYQTLLSSNLTAVPSSQAVTGTAPIISGTYTGTAQGVLTIISHPTGSNGYFTTSGLVITTGNMDPQIPQPIGTTGLFILFPGMNIGQSGSWTVSIPNTSGTSYTANSTAYQTALQTQTNAVAAAQANLDQVKAAPRTDAVAAAQAAVQSAQGALSAAQGALANDFITAPINGTITTVNDITVGQNVNANTPAIGIMSNSGFQIEAYVSEKDLGLVVVNTPVTIVTDAYGPSVVFNGKVVEVDPAATTDPSTGDTGYKVVYQFTDSDSRIKPGINATVTINGGTKDNVLEVPTTAIYQKDGASFVLVRTGSKNVETKVTTGLVGEDSVEITSGLTAGEQVVTLGNNS